MTFHSTLYLALLLGALFTQKAPNLRAQNTPNLAANELQSLQDDVRNILANLEDLKLAQLSMQEQLAALREENRHLKEELALAKSDLARVQKQFTTWEEFTKITEAIKDIDTKREADKKLILEQFANLAQLAAAPPPPIVALDPPAASLQTPPSASQPGFDYIVQPKDTLSSIVAAYNKDFEKRGLAKITYKDVQTANPNMKPDKIFPGQVIFIPAPDGF